MFWQKAWEVGTKEEMPCPQSADMSDRYVIRMTLPLIAEGSELFRRSSGDRNEG
jgi:hypothetical protein